MEPRLTPVSVAPATVPQRLHHLDAARAFAMILGIALHATLAFMPSAWPVFIPGRSVAGGLDEFFDFTHGFRMQLFFLLSGYFTTMLWRRRGFHALVAHRIQRILLPLVLAVPTLLPLTTTSVRVGRSLAGLAPLPDMQRDPLSLSYLWFLWQLFLMIGVFVVLAEGLARLKSERLCRARDGFGWFALLALPVVSLAFQYFMAAPGRRIFGPDLSDGLLPAPRVLAYYATFFFFGALAFERRDAQGRELLDRLGRWGVGLLPILTLGLFPLALWLTRQQDELLWPLALCAQVVFTWWTVFGFLGLFGLLFSRPRFWVRFVSDSAYWLYLAHIPLVFVAQGLAVRWQMSALGGFLFVTLLVTALLLASYRYLVRYRLVGRLLNGPRSREGDLKIRLSGVAALVVVLLSPGALMGCSRSSGSEGEVKGEAKVLPKEPRSSDSAANDETSGDTLAPAADETVTTQEPPTAEEVAEYAESPEGKLGPQLAFSRVTGGDGRFCGARSTGELVCWGRGAQTRPGPFSEVATRGTTACAVGVDGSIRCFGSKAPKAFGPKAKAATRIAAGGDAYCALERSGRVLCWNKQGQPALPPPGNLIGHNLAVGQGFACVSDPTDKLVCWGDVEQLWLPTLPTPVRDLAAGDSFVCAIVGDERQAKCWGKGPRLPQGRYRSLAAGYQTVCGVRVDQTAICRGEVETEFSSASRLAVGKSAVCAAHASKVELSCAGDADGGQLDVPRGPKLDLRKAEAVQPPIAP